MMITLHFFSQPKKTENETADGGKYSYRSVILIHFAHIIDLCMPPFYLQSEQKHHSKVHKKMW